MDEQIVQLEMTPKQLAMKNAVREFKTQHGYGPSVRELMSITGNKSSSNVVRILNDLVTRGHLRKGYGMRRAISVID